MKKRPISLRVPEETWKRLKAEAAAKGTTATALLLRNTEKGIPRGPVRARLKAAKVRARELAKQARKLEKLNEEPENQHCWDEWKETEVAATEAAGLVAVLESLLKL